MAKNKAKSDKWLKAALEGDLATVQEHIASGINIETTGQDGRTALMNAAGGCHADVVRALIAAKANVRAQSNNGADALMHLLAPDWAGIFRFSGKSDFTPTLKALLGAGASISKSHLVIAMLSHPPDIIEILAKTRRGALSRPADIQAAIAEAKQLRHEQNIDPDIFEANIRLLLQSFAKNSF